MKHLTPPPAPKSLTIQSVLKQRNIEYLVHFTPFKNTTSILEHGLLPRNQLPEDAAVTDPERWDRRLETICLSISWINQKMFDCKIKQHSLLIFFIDPKILYLKECAFFPHNAATACYRDLPFENFMGAECLEALFAEEISYQRSRYSPTTVRRNKNLDPNEPTSEQAEVLCRQIIEPEFILGFWDFDSKTVTPIEEFFKEDEENK